MNKGIGKKKTSIIIASLLIVLAALVPLVGVASKYAFYLISLGIIWTILAISADIMLRLGLASLAQGAFLGLGIYSVALGMTSAHWNWWFCALVGMVLAAITGLGLGLITLRLTGHYFAIGTLAFGIAIERLFENWDSFTHGARGVTGIPEISPIKLGSTTLVSFENETSMYYLLVVFLALVVVVLMRVTSSPFGRALAVIKSNENLAKALGINVTKYKVIAFMFSAMVAALSGALFAPFIHYIHPADASSHIGFVALIYTVIGGAGTWWGPIIGSQLMVVIPELMRPLQDYRLMIFGVVVIVVMILVPHGIAGGLKSLYEILSKRYGGNKKATL